MHTIEMKKVMMSALLCGAVYSSLQAQPGNRDSVEIEIEGSRISLEAYDLEALSALDLNTMIRDIVAKTNLIQKQQQEMLARIDRQLANGEISEEEAEEMRETVEERTEESMEVIGEIMETWGEAYGERWEAWAEEFEASMENWEAEVERRAEREGAMGQIPPIPPLPPLPPIGNPPAPEVANPQDSGKKSQKIIISDEGIIIEPGEGDDKPFALKFDKEKQNEKRDHKTIGRTETYVDLHFGFNQLMEDGQYIIVDEPAELKFWKSTQFELGLGGKTRLGSPYSKLYLKWGGSVSWHDFWLQGNNILSKTPSGRTIIAPDSSRAYSKSKFEIVYFNLPLMLQLDFSEVGEMDENFTLGLGGYIGGRLKSERELEYNDLDGTEVEQDMNNEFSTNRFRYGVMAQLGWKAFKITAQYDLNSYFRQNRGPLNASGAEANYQLAAISLGFTL